MSELVYVNGRWTGLEDATIHVEDRGFQFADGVYEVAAILAGQLLDWFEHVARLAANLVTLEIPLPAQAVGLEAIARRLIADNAIDEGTLYIQVTRGRARREHAYAEDMTPSLVMMALPFDFTARFRQIASDVTVAIHPDERWMRSDVKSIVLLPNMLAKQCARRAGAFEAWLIDRDGLVTEGASTTAYIVVAGALVTRPLSHALLSGITRANLLALARANGIAVEERGFTAREAAAADEALLSSTTVPCLPVVRIDDKTIGDGAPGSIKTRLAHLLWDDFSAQTGWKPRA